MKGLLFSEKLVGEETTYVLATMYGKILLSKEEALWFKEKLEKALSEEYRYDFEEGLRYEN